MTAFEILFENCPQIKAAIENKIADEVATRDKEIEDLKEKNKLLENAILDLASTVGGEA